MLDQMEWKMIRELKMSGLSITAISKYLKIDRKTVRRVLESTTSPKYIRKNINSKINSYQSYIDQRLEKFNLTSQKIFEEILEQGFSGKYGIVNKYVNQKKADYRVKATLRFETIPGEQGQVDWAYFGDFYDHDKKKLVRLCCFIMVLGYSRMRFIHFFDSDDTHNFLTGHNLAFTFFKGYPRELLYDNLKSVVLKRAFKQIDSKFNQEFLEFSGFYGFKAILAQPYRPQTKGKVENTVNFVRVNFFAGNDFKSVSEINKQALAWLNKVNNQIHHTTHERPLERFLRDTIIPLVGKTYDLSKVYYRKVQIDCHFSFRANFYSCPIEYAGKEVAIKEEDNYIYAYYRDEKIATHLLEDKSKGKYITSPAHYLEIKLATEKQSKQAWRRKIKQQTTDKAIKEQPKYQRSGFNSKQLIDSSHGVEQRDLNHYEEILQ